MPRSRAVLTAPILIVVVLIAFLAIRSRGSDKADLQAAHSSNCPPVARSDAVATKPGEPISIDVLANDTDVDGDPLVFQILKTKGGESTIDDGGTPTDASDDRLLFTPADPAPASATIDYQALDPQGAMGKAVVTVAINTEGVMPAGAASEAVTEIEEGTGRCGSDRSATPTTAGLSTTLLTEPPYTGDLLTAAPKSSSGTKTNTNRTTTTTTKKSSSTSTTTSGPGTTSPPHSTTTSPPNPTTTTTQPSGPTTTQKPPPDCGPYPQSGSQAEKEAWQKCYQDYYKNP